MTTRDVELIIKARDQATSIAKSVTDAFEKLTTAEATVGNAAAESTAEIARLKAELVALQAAAKGLGQFAQVAANIDRSAASLGRLAANSDRAQQAMVLASQQASAAASNQRALAAQADAASKSLEAERSTLARLNQEFTRQKQVVADLGGSRVANQATAAPGGVSPAVARLAETRSALAQQRVVVNEAAAAYTTLERELAKASTEMRRANVGFETTTIAARESASALLQAEGALETLRAEAATTSTALGGVAASQEAIRNSSQQTAATIGQLTAAIEEQGRKAAAARAAMTVAPDSSSVTGLNQQMQAQAAVVERTRQAWRAATADVARLAQQIQATKNPTAQLRAEFSLARIAATDAKAAFQAQSATLSEIRVKLFEAVQAKRADVQASIQARQALDAYNNSLRGTIRNLLGLKNPAQQATAALNAQAQAAQRAAQGLSTADRQRTQRVQNLAFQVNDVLTQLASGTSLTRALGQQAGQFAQLSPTFNNLLVSLLRFVPILAVIGAALSPVIAAFLNLGNQARSVREFNVALAGTEQASQQSAQGLAATVRALDEYRGTVADARAVTQQFLRDGLDSSAFVALGQAVSDVAKALGQEAPEAAQALGRALNGNIDDVLNLDRQLNFLTRSERERIRVLEETTNAENRASNERERATIISEAYQRRADAIADASRGSWSVAFRELGRAFNDVVRAFENTGIIQALGRAFDELGDKVTRAARNFRVGFAFLTNGFNRADAIAGVRESDARAGASGDPRDPNSPEAQRRAEALAATQREFNRELDRTNQRRADAVRLSNMGRDAAAGERAVLDAQAEARRAGVTLTEAQIEATRQAAVAESRANNARRQGASETQNLARRQREFNLALADEIAQRELQIRLLGMTSREAAIESAVEQARLRAAQSRVQITEQQLEQIRASAAALYDAQIAEQGRNELLQMQIQLREMLNQQVSVDQQIQEEALLRNIDLTTEYGRAWEEMRRRVIETTNQINALREAEELARARTANLRQGERDFEEARNNGESNEELERRREELERQRDLIIEARDRAIELATALGDEAAIERMEALNTNIADLGLNILTAAQANQMLTDGLTSGVMDAVDQIGMAIDGTQSWGDALRNVGDIFRQFAADFLKQIAKMILQAIILRAIQSSGLGGFISGGVGAVVKHGGGLIGSRGRSRNLDPRVLAGAMRFHTGGFPGLAQNEVPAILQRGEEVLSRRDPRNALNGGGGGGDGKGIRIINAIDPADFIDKGMNSPQGTKTLLNWMSANRTAIQGALG